MCVCRYVDDISLCYASATMSSPAPGTVRLALGAVLLVALVSATRVPPPSAGQALPARWLKGNTHTHTTESDGDSSPDVVTRWYREHGYQFLVLSDHNVLTSIEALSALHGKDDEFLLIKGEEVTDKFGDATGPHQRPRCQRQGGSPGRHVAPRRASAQRRGDSPRSRRAPRQSPELPMGVLDRGAAAGAQHAAARDLQRSPAGQQPRWRRGAWSRRGLGRRFSRAER